MRYHLASQSIEQREQQGLEVASRVLALRARRRLQNAQPQAQPSQSTVIEGGTNVLLQTGRLSGIGSVEMQNEAPEVDKNIFKHCGPREVSVAKGSAPIRDEIPEEPHREVIIYEALQEGSLQAISSKRTQSLFTLTRMETKQAEIN